MDTDNNQKVKKIKNIIAVMLFVDAVAAVIAGLLTLTGAGGAIVVMAAVYIVFAIGLTIVSLFINNASSVKFAAVSGVISMLLAAAMIVAAVHEIRSYRPIQAVEVDYVETPIEPSRDSEAMPMLPVGDNSRQSLFLTDDVYVPKSENEQVTAFETTNRNVVPYDDGTVIVGPAGYKGYLKIDSLLTTDASKFKPIVLKVKGHREARLYVTSVGVAEYGGGREDNMIKCITVVTNGQLIIKDK